jgi:hypothetical protein
MNNQMRRLCREQEGQTIYLVAMTMFVILGMAAISIDIGFALHGQRELQASADAAATAGAEALSDNDTATGAQNWATEYSGKATHDNSIKDLSNVAVTATAKCLTSTNVCAACPCGNTTSGDNAMAVTEMATAPTFFAKIFGVSSISLSANALASIKSSTVAPANIFVILDTTGSMTSPDSACAGSTMSGISNPTSLDCAKYGVRVFLSLLDPCSISLSSCGPVTNGNVANPVDEVSLMIFPGLTGPASSSCAYCSTDAQYEYTNCGRNAKGTTPYAAPGTYPPYYTVTPLGSDFKTSDATVASCTGGNCGLNGANSDLVDAVDYGDGSTQGCGATSDGYGVTDATSAGGGHATYYAGAIFEAQSYISALPAPRNSMQSAIVLLSDGAANATVANGDFAAGTPATYTTNPCHLAIKAAQAAAGTQNAAGLYTWVYAIAYNSSTVASASCNVDSPAISGCTTMQDIASDPTKFYSDDKQNCSSPDNPSITTLAGIFGKVADDFKTTRLLPWNTN